MSEEMISLILDEASTKMSDAVDHAKREFSGVRSGKATPALVDRIQVDYYGSMVPLQQIAGFSLPEARLLVISPFDKSAIEAIEKAISASDLGLTPSNDGTVIRLSFPPLTEERRRDLVKVVRNMAEESRLTVRSARRSARSDLEQMQKDGDASEDDISRAEKQVDSLTEKYETEIDTALQRKEDELLEV